MNSLEVETWWMTYFLCAAPKYITPIVTEDLSTGECTFSIINKEHYGYKRK